jgi:hypothetical protein
MKEEEEVNVKTEKVMGIEEEECIDIKDEYFIYSEEEKEDVEKKEDIKKIPPRAWMSVCCQIEVSATS